VPGFALVFITSICLIRDPRIEAEMASRRSSSEDKKPKLTTEEQLAHIQKILSERVSAGAYDNPGPGVSVKELKKQLGIE
jgi:hypothetical protein